MNLKKSVNDFISGIKFIAGKPPAGEGNRQLAKMAILAEQQIAIYGKNAVRKSLIDSIEKDFKRAAKKGGKEKVDEMLNDGLGTPEYMHLCHSVGLEEPHLRVMAMKAKKNIEIKNEK